MATAQIITRQGNFGKVSVASVASSYAALDPSTKPTSGIVFDYQSIVAPSPSLLRLLPYANTATGLGASIGMRVVGYTAYPNAAGTATLWIPTVLADLTLAFSTGTVPTWNIDGTGDVRPFATTTQVAGTPTVNLYSPGTAAATNVEPAAVLLDPVGSQLVQVQFKATGTPTMGVFWTTL